MITTGANRSNLRAYNLQYCKSQQSAASELACNMRSLRKPLQPRDAKKLEAACFTRARLRPGATIVGPALIVENQTTTVVTGALTAQLNAFGDIVMHTSTSN